MLTDAILRRLWPHGDSKVPGLIAGIVASAPVIFPKYGLLSPLVVAHAMAQFSHECGAGTEMVENINYSAERACQVWPSRFSSAAQCYARCDSFEGDPQFHIKLIDHVYGGRMGNAPYPAHDGSRFIGRGLSQCTGREGYEKLAKATGLDLVNHPELVSSPGNALECGVADFVICGCLPYAKANDIDKVTLKLNGGHIGLAERKEWFAKWNAALQGAQSYSAVPTAAPAPSIVPAQPVTPPAAPVAKPPSSTSAKQGGIAAFILAIATAVAAFWQQHHTAVIVGIAAVAVAAGAYFIFRKK